MTTESISATHPSLLAMYIGGAIGVITTVLGIKISSKIEEKFNDVRYNGRSFAIFAVLLAVSSLLVGVHISLTTSPISYSVYAFITFVLYAVIGGILMTALISGLTLILVMISYAGIDISMYLTQLSVTSTAKNISHELRLGLTIIKEGIESQLESVKSNINDRKE